MHTIGAGGASDIGSIVDEQSCVAATRNLNRARHKLVKHTAGQQFFTYLKDRNSCGDGGVDQPEDVCELRIFRSCLRGRLAARYRIDDRQWKVERHFEGGRFDSAKP